MGRADGRRARPVPSAPPVPLAPLAVSAAVSLVAVASGARPPSFCVMSETNALLRGLDQSFDGDGWHGPTLLAAADGMGAAEAVWRPAPDAHNAWEYVVHAAYWTHRALRHVAPDPPQEFDEPGSNFFPRPAPSRTLAGDVERLRQWHGRLRAAVATLDPGRLDEAAYDGYSVRDLVVGVAAHDAYHAGQVRLVRRLWALRDSG